MMVLKKVYQTVGDRLTGRVALITKTLPSGSSGSASTRRAARRPAGSTGNVDTVTAGPERTLLSQPATVVTVGIKRYGRLAASSAWNA